MKLEFTGERFTPECVREIWYEHYHRYAFVKRLVKDKKVLDAACGEGYGSYILATEACQVTGLDIDQLSINHANNKYKKSNLEYRQGSCIDLTFKDDSFDCIISFETIEHLLEQQQMLDEFNRVLKPNGFIVVSTPDKKHYSDESGFTNEFHVKELYKQEFKDLLDSHWPYQEWYSQALSFNSIMQQLDKKDSSYSSDILDDEELVADGLLTKPMYYVVIACKNKDDLPKLNGLHLFSDKQQTVYEHYNKTIKDYIYLANKHNDLLKQHESWLSIPVLGKILKYLTRDK
jgi:2-polyprenyl-3-methyl-5-hydroxy-6-metoxy-1,4-benzoquinol methylase